jgi:hypothetical protein
MPPLSSSDSTPEAGPWQPALSKRSCGNKEIDKVIGNLGKEPEALWKYAKEATIKDASVLETEHPDTGNRRTRIWSYTL